MLPAGKLIQLAVVQYRLGRAAAAPFEPTASTLNCTPEKEPESTSHPLPLTSGSLSPGRKNCCQ
eukprot:1285008-Rhodomonas_salina.1